jgi:serine/threonine protein kinase
MDATTTQPCYYCGSQNDLDSQQCANCGNLLVLQGRYLLLRVLGQGGFGVVYEATDQRLNRRCAIKRVTATSLEEQHEIQNEADILARHASNLGFLPTIYDTWVDQAQT